ncbi:hypothetical protein [Rhizobium leguminosarum]
MPKSTEVLPECTQLKDPGKLRPFLEAFTSRLLNLGHTRLTVSSYEASARHFGQWLQSTKIAITEIDDDVVRALRSIEGLDWKRVHAPSETRTAIKAG